MTHGMANQTLENEALGDRIRDAIWALMGLRRLKMAGLALSLGWPRQTLVDRLKARPDGRYTRISIEELNAIARALDVSLEDLIALARSDVLTKGRLTGG